MERRIAVIGLGYVGLPVALAFARKFQHVIGFDLNANRIDALRRGVDVTGETSRAELEQSSLRYSNDPTELAESDFFVVAVPTPVDNNNRPDLSPMRRASITVASVLRPGSIVVYESTVYPGATEEVCRPLLAETSGLRAGVDFKVGYSPERINPGDREHRLESIIKIVAGEDAETLEVVAGVYGAIIEAGVHRAESIKVAEAAKVIENTQRDLNIALMNEFAMIFDRCGIRTRDVLAAARTKWNFLGFTPGLVGGHCIGVDPYYLTHKAEELGYHPEVILAGRRINDTMGLHVAQRLVKMLAAAGRDISRARVGILGLTFKENVPDLRNSQVPTIVDELRTFGIRPLVHDACAEPAEAARLYEIDLCDWSDLKDLDGLVVAVSHSEYLRRTAELPALVREGGAVVDVKSILDPRQFQPRVSYWSL